MNKETSCIWSALTPRVMICLRWAPHGSHCRPAAVWPLHRKLQGMWILQLLQKLLKRKRNNGKDWRPGRRCRATEKRRKRRRVQTWHWALGRILFLNSLRGTAWGFWVVRNAFKTLFWTLHVDLAICRFPAANHELDFRYWRDLGTCLMPTKVSAKAFDWHEFRDFWCVLYIRVSGVWNWKEAKEAVWKGGEWEREQDGASSCCLERGESAKSWLRCGQDPAHAVFFYFVVAGVRRAGL